MYFWKIDKLVEDLREDRVTQKEEFKYLLFNAFIFSVATGSFFEGSIVYGFYDVLYSMLYPLIACVGLYFCYTANARGDGQQFLKRIVCLLCPVTIRLLSVFVALLIVFFILVGPIESDSGEITIEFIMLCVFSDVLGFVYLFLKIKDVSNMQK